MRKLLAFIWKYYFIFLFVLLEIIAFIIIVNSSYYQGSSILRSTGKVTGTIYTTYSNISAYLFLKKANSELANENTALHNQSRQAYLITDTSTFITGDSIWDRQYFFIMAKAISNTTSKKNNYLLLNKGKKHGIDKDMAVINQSGIVGIINEVSNNFSSVISVLHGRTGISARIKSNNQVGSLTWDGKNYRQGLLKDIPAHTEIIIGDTVVTSGYSHIFPEGIMIGTIHDFEIEPGSKVTTIEINFSVDFNNIYYVEVIKNLYHEEQDILEKDAEVE